MKSYLFILLMLLVFEFTTLKTSFNETSLEDRMDHMARTEQCHERAMTTHSSSYTIDCPVGSHVEASGMDGDWLIVCQCKETESSPIHRWDGGI